MINLLKLHRQNLSSHIFFQNYHSDKYYNRGHAQLRNSQTTAILDGEKRSGAKHNRGIFIDIFILDAVENNNKKLFKQKFMVKYLKYLLERKDDKFSDKRTFKGILAFMLVKIVFLFTNKKRLIKRLDNLFRKKDVNQYENVAPLNFIFEINKRIRNKHLYDNEVMLDFEWLKFPAPAGYDEFLKKRYGDYMKPAQIPTTHGDVFFDVNKSYIEYDKKK